MSETVTAHAVRVGEKLKDVPRGGSAARSALSPEIEKGGGSQKTLENKAISHLPRASRGRPASSAGRSSQGRSAFIPILPADISAGDGADSAFRFLGSKTDPILHVSYPSPWNFVADFAPLRGENRKNSNWRREWDSNPRTVSRRRFSRPMLSSTQPSLRDIQIFKKNGAGEGNRTLVTSLEGWGSTIELHPLWSL